MNRLFQFDSNRNQRNWSCEPAKYGQGPKQFRIRRVFSQVEPMRVDVSEYVDSVPKYGRRLWTNRCVCTFNFHRCKCISTRGVYAHVDVISSYQSTWFTAVSLHLFSVLWHLSSVCPIDQFALPILFRWSPFELKLVHFVLVLGYLNSFDVGLFKLIGLVWVVDWIYDRYFFLKNQLVPLE